MGGVVGSGGGSCFPNARYHPGPIGSVSVDKGHRAFLLDYYFSSFCYTSRNTEPADDASRSSVYKFQSSIVLDNHYIQFHILLYRHKNPNRKA